MKTMVILYWHVVSGFNIFITPAVSNAVVFRRMINSDVDAAKYFVLMLWFL